MKVEYNNKITIVSSITLCGQYVMSYNVREKLLLILELEKPIVPGTEATTEALAAAKPIFAVHIPNTGSLVTLQKWITYAMSANLKEDHRVQSLPSTPQVYTLKIEYRRANRSSKADIVSGDWAITCRPAGVPKGWPPCLRD